MEHRRFFLVLTVKNEAPNIWEWVAHHRAAGFTDIAVYQNDSEDGTDLLLEAMAEQGLIQYFPNESPRGAWQNRAYRRAARLEAYRTADWAMALDADEFLIVRVGDGRVGDLVDALDPEVNACTVHWKLFGSAHHARMPEGLVTEAFTLAEHPDRVTRRKVGFKTIFRPSVYRRPGIHTPKARLPDMPAVYCNGSGIALDPDQRIGWRSKDAGGRVFAQVNHYAIRDLERFLVKCGRGRTSNHQRLVDRVYWNDFNFNHAVDDQALQRLARTRDEMARMDALTGGRLSALTAAGRAATAAVLEELLRDPYFNTIYHEIAAEFPQHA